MRRVSLFALAGCLLTAPFWQGTGLSNTLAQGTEAPAPATAQAPQTSGLPTTKPIIHGSLNGTPVDGILGSYCWPQADPSTPQCDIVDDPQPTNPINVSNGDSIVFTSDLASPQPQSLQATLLDDKNADNEQIVVTLTNTGGIFSVTSLNPGNHRLQVSAMYTGDAQSNQPFVNYVFLLVVAGTGPATVSPSSPGGPAATGAPEGFTPIAATETVGQPAGPATSPAVAPTVESPATQAAQPTEVLPQATPTPAPLIQPTDTPVPATPIPATPIPQPTVAQVAQPTEIPANPTLTSSGASSGQGSVEMIPGISVPQTILIVEARSFDAIAVNSCVEGTQGETICINRPTNTTSITAFGVAGDVAQINFKGPKPTAVSVSLFSSDGTTLVNKQVLKADNLLLYTLPSAAGNFVLNVEIVYPGGKATYYFRLNLSN